MSRVDDVFSQLRSQAKRALIPFVTAGDPDLDFTRQLVARLAQIGCPLVEVGIPYSDPIADGPVIQASYTRALNAGIRLEAIWQSLQQITSELPVPLVVMCSYAIIYRVGPEVFLKKALEAGVAGAIVPDLLIEELPPLAAIASRYDFPLIQLVTPTTPRPRAVRIAEASRGFLYYVSVTGITGERSELPQELVENVAWLRSKTPLPVCIGFGISSPEHVRRLAPVADGLIVGSAIVRRVAAVETTPRAQVLEDVEAFVRSLLQALNDST
jgi:tryptophan synthase alpha chain